MRVMIIGDVVGQPGCDFLRKRLPAFKREQKVDAVICNGENSAVGNGILPQSANFLFDSGVDVITGGNHSFKRREIQDYIEEHPDCWTVYEGSQPYGIGWRYAENGQDHLEWYAKMVTAFKYPNPYNNVGWYLD